MQALLPDYVELHDATVQVGDEMRAGKSIASIAGLDAVARKRFVKVPPPPPPPHFSSLRVTARSLTTIASVKKLKARVHPVSRVTAQSPLSGREAWPQHPATCAGAVHSRACFHRVPCLLVHKLAHKTRCCRFGLG